MTILITGARGNVGRHVIEALLAANVPVRAASRDPASTHLPERVETIAADLTKPETLPAALKGIRKVFLYAEPQGVDGFVNAAKDAGVEQIVLLSSSSVVSPNAASNPIAQRHLAVEHPIADSGIPSTFIRPGAFATNTLQWSAAIRAHRAVHIPYPGAHTAPIHERDIAAVAVCTLTDARHQGASYVLTGPESLSQQRQVDLIGKAIGEPIRCEELSPKQAHEKIPDALLRYLAATDARPVPVNTTVQEITGQPARTFAQWALDHTTDFR
ncbi:NAD(P)H-binding protein [Actinoallomurus acanthiterrae]